METVEQRVHTLLRTHLGVDAEKVVPEALLVDDLGADSLDLVEIELAVEEEFDIRFPTKDDGAFDMAHCVCDIVAITSKQIEAEKGAAR